MLHRSYTENCDTPIRSLSFFGGIKKKTSGLLFSIFLFLSFFSINFAQNPEWVVYTTDNSGLHHDHISSIAIDNSGNKWIGSFQSGLASFDGTNWTIYDTSNSGLPDNDVMSIAIDGNGNKWIGTGFGGVAFFDGTNWTVHTTDIFVDAMAVDSSGNTWIGTYHHGLACFDGTSWTIYNTSNSDLPDNWVHSIAIDENNNKWIGTRGGLVVIDGTNWTVYNTSNSGLPSNIVRSIAFDSNGNKWLGTQSGGLAFFDGTNWTVYDTSNSGMPHEFVSSLAIDGSGNKWIGTFRQGLAFFDGTNWTVYDTSNSDLPDNDVRSIAIDGSGNKWIGTGGGLAVYNDVVVISIEPDRDMFTDGYTLYQNYPNPFNPVTEICYELPNRSLVSLTVYDLLGRRVAILLSEMQDAGYKSVIWDATDDLGQPVSAGIYFYRIKVEYHDGISNGNHVQTRKMVLLE